ncbi:hypothetical protein RQP46_008270 [Phenoliferia psychrophenolica]
MPPGKALQKTLPSGGLPISPSPFAAAPSSSRVGLKVLLAQPLFVAGEKVKGVLEVRVGSGEIALGDMGIEFSAFQGSFYPALRGRTRFAFSFDLPHSSPSSCSLGRNATTRYELRAFASSLVKGEVDIQSDKIEVKVVERWSDWKEGRWKEGLERKDVGKLKMAGEGKLEVTACVGMGEDGVGKGRLFWRKSDEAGGGGNGTIAVLVHVKNGSKRSISGLKLSLCRRLRILNANGTAPLVTAVVHTEPFRGVGFEFPAGQERSVWITTEIPDVECSTVRHGTLFELDTHVRVDWECGFLAKDLSIELPIYVAHPLSLPPAAHASHPVLEPSLPAHVPFPGSPQALASQSFNYPYQQPPGGSFTEFGAYPSTPDPYHRALSTAPTPQPAAYHSLPQHHHHHQHSQSLPTPIQYIAFDPRAPEMTQSQFLGTMSHHQPQQVWAPEEKTMSVPLGTPSRPTSPLYAEAALSPPPATFSPHEISRSPSPRGFRDDEQAQLELNIAPAHAFSAQSRAESLISPPLPSPSMSRPLRTPPPPSPSSRFSPSSFANPHPPADPNLLDTIGEDGESQAGTMKSVNLAAFEDDSLHRPTANSPGRNSVKDLEDFVEDESKMKDLAMDKDKDKTLPGPPVPSDRTKTVATLPRAQDIFQRQPSPPPSPPPTVASPKINLIPRSEGGLNKLEALLSRPSTPDVSSLPSSPPPIPSPSRALSPPARSETLSPPQPSALRARGLSRAKSNRELASLLDAEDPREAVKKALLAAAPPPSPRSRTASTPTKMSSSVSTPSFVGGRKVVNEDEVNGIKKEAVGRVATWLKDDGEKKVEEKEKESKIEAKKPEEEPKRTPIALKRATIDFVRPAPAPPSSSMPPPLWTTKPRSTSPIKRTIPSTSPTKPSFKTSLAPSFTSPDLASLSSRPVATRAGLVSSRSASFLASAPTPTSAEPTMEELISKLPPSTSLAAPKPPGEDKYNLRSARGGRGGVVSSVAGLWAEKIDSVERDLTKPPLAPLATASKAAPKIAPSFSTPTSPAVVAPTPTYAHRADPPRALAPKTPTYEKRWSEPSLAKPFVNTTMGKPPVLSKTPPVGAPAEVKPVGKVTGGIANLIARYSQEVARP